MSELEFWQMLLKQIVADGLLSIEESSEILSHLAKEVSK